MDYRHHGLRARSVLDSFFLLRTSNPSPLIRNHTPQGSIFYFPIDGDWISECRDMSIRRRALHRHFCSEIPSTFAWDARRPVSTVYRVDAVLEVCLGKGYVPEREDLHNLLLLSLNRAIRWLRLKTRKIKQ